MIDCLEYKFYDKGDYLFHKGDKADYAYFIIYGQVVFLDVVTASYSKGKEPLSPLKRNKKAEEERKNELRSLGIRRRTIMK